MSAVVTEGTQWYVARIKPTIDWDIITFQLERQGFGSWMPIIVAQQYFAGRKTITQQPLYPCYLFVSVDVKRQRWRQINSTVGVNYLLPSGTAELPRPLPLGFVEQLRTTRTVREVVEVTKIFLRDETVRIISGPLALADRPLARVVWSGNQNTRVELSLPTGGKMEATVATQSLEPASV